VEPELISHAHEFRDGARTHLLYDMRALHLDRFLAGAKLGPHLLVQHADTDESEDLLLALRERLEPGAQFVDARSNRREDLSALERGGDRRQKDVRADPPDAWRLGPLRREDRSSCLRKGYGRANGRR
jgi:hypothetical protein